MRVDVFSENHAFAELCAYVCHLGKCDATRVVEHPYAHSVPVLADGAAVTFAYKRKACKATVERVDAVVGTMEDSVVMRKLTLTGPSTFVYGEFEADAHAHWRAGGKGKIQVFYARYNEMYATWERAALLPRRSPQSVVIDPDVKKRVRDGLTSFLESEHEYDEQGLPYKFVAMLHGPPGTGKTSTIFALAGEAGIENVYVMSFGSTMTDSNFLQLVHSMSTTRSCIVFEDCDTLVVNRKDKTGMSFTTMLNVLDGYLRPHGMIAFLTTNHLERFDAAMLREGRMDITVLVPELNADLAAELAKRVAKVCKRLSADERTTVAAAVVARTTNPSKISSFLFMNRKGDAKTILAAIAAAKWGPPKTARKKTTKQIGRRG
jgi:ABC-type cobalamin/Fe3+-siderophores transport system ATPase subunit